MSNAGCSFKWVRESPNLLVLLTKPYFSGERTCAQRKGAGERKEKYGLAKPARFLGH